MSLCQQCQNIVVELLPPNNQYRMCKNLHVESCKKGDWRQLTSSTPTINGVKFYKTKLAELWKQASEVSTVSAIIDNSIASASSESIDSSSVSIQSVDNSAKSSALCKYENCTKYASFGLPTEKAEFCKVHKPNDYVNVKSKRCKFLNCDKIPNYGKFGTTIAEYCSKHHPEGYADIKSKRCSFKNCDKQPKFGKIGTKIAEYCAKHKPDDYVNVRSKLCTFHDCNKIPCYGKLGSKTAEYCAMHKPDDYIDILHKKCIYPNCNKQSSYGSKYTKIREYCILHKPNDYIELINKRCIHPICEIRATYGKIGAKIAEYCAKHKPEDYVNIKSKLCIHPKCTRIPVFGNKSAKCAEYCSEHKPDEYINIKDKICVYIDCDKQASFGKINTKKPEYCDKHKPEDYVNVKNKQCIHQDCENRPYYGKLGYSSTYCASHAPKGYIRKSLKRCCADSCKKVAEYIENNQFYCPMHKTAKATNLQQICSFCCCIIDPDATLCDSCSKINEGDRLKHTKQKEEAIKEFLKTSNIEFIHDHRVAEGCSSKRPDFLIMGNYGQYIVLEIDEFQHNRKTYTCECEITRMRQIYYDIGQQCTIFIRYNPDKYEPFSGKPENTATRQRFLLETIQKYKTLSPDPSKPITVVYMFYDGHTTIDNSTDYINI